MQDRGGEPKKKKRVRAPLQELQVLHIFSQCSFQLPRESATSRPVDLSFCPGSKSEGNLIGFRISVRRINFPCFSQERSSQLAGQSADHTERRTTRQSFGNSTCTRDSGVRVRGPSSVEEVPSKKDRGLSSREAAFS